MNQTSGDIANLDLLCAELGRELAAIPRMREKVLNDALAVLEEQGLYALFLYVEAQSKEVAREFLEKCAEFLGIVFCRGSENALEIAQALGEDLDELLFARELLRQALCYGKYHLRAGGN
ncbi:MAG: hypothetical protein QHH27_04295 [Clostridia bacterium]|nr:hypothetical protein [Clostridia bacterium]MDH7572761.1 hypothetical protein [Clostridia bacterium]